METESNLVNVFIERMSESLTRAGIKKQFRFAIEDKWKTGKDTSLSFDLVMYRKDEPFVVVEFLNTVENLSPTHPRVAKSIHWLNPTNARFLIYTNNQVYLVYKNGGKSFEELKSIDEIVRLFKEKDSAQTQQKNKKTIASSILDVALEIFANPDVKSLVKRDFFKWIQNSKSSLEKKIDYDPIGGFYFFAGFNNAGETTHEFDFFQLLLNDGEPITEIYRYTSFDSLYHTLNKQSIRIAGIAGMNDTTEAFYFDKYQDAATKPFWETDTKHATIDAVNRRFILSSSLLEDNLTQWRLYGDDCKGVCLVFAPKRNSKHTIVLAKISYAKTDRTHPELDFLNKLIESLKAVGIIFKFRYSYIWKHFFKPYDYAIEQEVRLLVIMAKKKSTLNKEWRPTDSHKILNPYILYDIDSLQLPLTLRKITLGAHCPEKEVNKVQIEQLLRERPKFKKLKIEVDISKIDNYRGSGK